MCTAAAFLSFLSPVTGALGWKLIFPQPSGAPGKGLGFPFLQQAMNFLYESCLVFCINKPLLDQWSSETAHMSGKHTMVQLLVWTRIGHETCHERVKKD